jgi:drug/metabolite transporter (DMT)-like permease
MNSRTGVAWGFIGVLAFSFTVPLTRIAVGGLNPLFIGSARAVVAAILAAIVLFVTHQRIPNLIRVRRLAIVGAGVVVGFPILTSYAMGSVPASHAAVIIGLLPAATAVTAVLRTGERPAPRFWFFAGLGATAAVVFASFASGQFGQFHWADLLLCGAVISAAIGYSEGALVSREIGSWQTISWALVICLPLMVALMFWSISNESPSATGVEWLSFLYLGIVSMFLAFFAWYRGLAIGPMTAVSQVQLTQPVLSIAWAALLLGETITIQIVLGGIVVVACAALAVRTRLKG